jgi:ATP-binding cassette, subfamily B, bacterial
MSMPECSLLPPHRNACPTALGYVLHVAVQRYRWWIFGMLLGETGNAACGILLPYALGRIITYVTRSQGSPRTILTTLAGPIVLFALLCLGELVCGRISSAIQLRVAPRQRQYVARSLFHHLHRHSHRYLTENFAGSLAHRISETSYGVNQVIFAIVTEFWPIAIILIVSNGLLLAAQGWLGLFTSLWSAAFVFASLQLSRRTLPLAAAASTARSRTIGGIVDSVSNHATVRLFAAQDHEQERLVQAHAGELQTVLRANRAMERVRLLQFAASAILKAGVVAASVWLWSCGKLGVGQFVMAVSLSLLIISEARNISRRFLEFFEALGNVGSGVRAILQPHEIKDPPSALPLRPSQGGIEFRSVSFAYVDGSEVFRNLSVKIPGGQKVGLVGLSGSGKSTFVSLLLRLYDPQSGQICIDGQDLRSLTQDSIHSQIGLIPQDPTLFHRSLRENIRYGRPQATEEELDAATQQARASEFLRDIPGGLDAEVGERGVKLSGGQRQRIAIARVVLKNPPLLVLDEATSSLDSLTERAIQDALDEVMDGKTVIVIAHRLSTIAHLDRILVFDRGAIVEDGSHQELLQNRGAYFRLWSQQIAGRLPEESAAARSRSRASA